MKVINLTQNKVALVDDADYDFLCEYSWVASNSGREHWYAVVRTGTHISMHRLLMQVPEDVIVDHINRDTLDNRRCNLRAATRAQNAQNAEKHVDNTSGFKGVSWNLKRKMWEAQICYNRRKKNLGYYPSKIEASWAYNHAAKKYHGAFAHTTETHETS